MGVSETGSLRVCVFDGSPIVRASLMAVIDKHDGMQAVTCAGTFGDAALIGVGWDVVMVGVPSDGAAVSTLRQAADLESPIVVCLHAVRDHLIGAALELGIQCIVSTADSAVSMAHAVRSAARRNSSFGRTIWRRFKSSKSGHVRLRSSDLTDGHRRLIAGVCRGWTSERLAKELGVSASTVEYRKRRLVAELGLRKSIDLLRYARSEGFMDAWQPNCVEG